MTADVRDIRTRSPLHAASIAVGTGRRIWRHPENRHRRWWRLAGWLGWQVVQRTVRRPLDLPFHGDLRLRCHPHDPIASAVLYYGLPDAAEMRLLLGHLRPGETFLDVGANIGLYSLLAATVPGVTAVAFEPGALASGRLEENVERNGLGRSVRIERAAVGARVGSARLTSDRYAMNKVVDHLDAGDVEEAPSTEVAMTTLDGWAAVNPGLAPAVVKIDVEGHELAVLEGARALLLQHRPVLIVEVNDTDGLTARFDELGYRPFRYSPDTGLIDPTQVADHVGGNVLAAVDVDAVRRRLG